MSRALFTAVSGLKAHQTKMDVIGNNIANVSTYGFKTGRVTFRDVFYQNMGTGASSNVASGGLGGQNPYQIGYGSMVSTIDTNQGKTGFATTGLGSDCYLNGDGLFAVASMDKNDPTAIGEVLYTRVGMFDFDSGGYLVDPTGRVVCGVSSDATDATPQEELKPIHYDKTEGGANADKIPLKSITISGDGKITGIGTDGKTYGFGDGGDLIDLTDDPEAACLAISVANIPNPAGMTMVGNSYYTLSGNAGNVGYYQAGKSNMASVKTGGLEMSGTDISQEFAEMIMTQRGFQANSRIVTVVDSMLEEVVNMKR